MSLWRYGDWERCSGQDIAYIMSDLCCWVNELQERRLGMYWLQASSTSIIDGIPRTEWLIGDGTRKAYPEPDDFIGFDLTQFISVDPNWDRVWQSAGANRTPVLYTAQQIYYEIVRLLNGTTLYFGSPMTAQWQSASYFVKPTSPYDAKLTLDDLFPNGLSLPVPTWWTLPTVPPPTSYRKSVRSLQIWEELRYALSQLTHLWFSLTPFVYFGNYKVYTGGGAIPASLRDNRSYTESGYTIDFHAPITFEFNAVIAQALASAINLTWFGQSSIGCGAVSNYNVTCPFPYTITHYTNIVDASAALFYGGLFFDSSRMQKIRGSIIESCKYAEGSIPVYANGGTSSGGGAVSAFGTTINASNSRFTIAEISTSGSWPKIGSAATFNQFIGGTGISVADYFTPTYSPPPYYPDPYWVFPLRAGSSVNLTLWHASAPLMPTMSQPSSGIGQLFTKEPICNWVLTDITNDLSFVYTT